MSDVRAGGDCNCNCNCSGGEWRPPPCRGLRPVRCRCAPSSAAAAAAAAAAACKAVAFAAVLCLENMYVGFRRLRERCLFSLTFRAWRTEIASPPPEALDAELWTRSLHIYRGI